jgi:amino acid adenylation domain-containing protein
VQEVLGEAGDHQELPFAQLVDELVAERDPSRPPLFQISVRMRDARCAGREIPGLTLEEMPATLHTAPCDLVFQFDQMDNDRLRLTLNFNTDVLANDQVARLTKHLIAVIVAIKKQAGVPIAELAILGKGENAFLAGSWSGIPSTPAQTGTVVSRFAELRQQHPDAPAVDTGSEVLDYAELDARANRMAHLLIGRGVQPGDRVGVAVGAGLDRVVALLGILKAGAGYLPLDATVAAPATVRLVLADADHPVADVEVLTLPAAGLADQPATDPAVVVRADDLGCVLPAADSGRPVALRHAGIVALAVDPCFLGGDERVLLHSPLTSGAALTELWVPLLRGGTVVVAGPGGATAAGLAATVTERELTGLVLGDGLFRAVAGTTPEALAGLRTVVIAGAVPPSPAVRRVLTACPGLRLVNGFGPTEGTVMTTSHPMIAAAAVPDLVTAGRPLQSSRIFVLTPELEFVTSGVFGELYVAGDQLALGYADDPAGTAEHFIPCPFLPGQRMYRTGDLVRWRWDGQLDFAGRVDGQVRIRGFRVQLTETEVALVEFPGVIDAVVADRPSAGRSRLAAWLVTDSEVDLAELHRFLAGRLPEHLIPAEFATVAELPLAQDGTIDAARLPEPTRTGRETERVEPSPGPQAELAAVFATVLGRAEVAATDDFFALGGDSAGAVRVAALARAAGLEFEPAELFRRPTVAGLVEVAVRRDEALAGQS